MNKTQSKFESKKPLFQFVQTSTQTIFQNNVINRSRAQSKNAIDECQQSKKSLKNNHNQFSTQTTINEVPQIKLDNTSKICKNDKDESVSTEIQKIIYQLKSKNMKLKNSYESALKHNLQLTNNNEYYKNQIELIQETNVSLNYTINAMKSESSLIDWFGQKKQIQNLIDVNIDLNKKLEVKNMEVLNLITENESLKKNMNTQNKQNIKEIKEKNKEINELKVKENEVCKHNDLNKKIMTDFKKKILLQEAKIKQLNRTISKNKEEIEALNAKTINMNNIIEDQKAQINNLNVMNDSNKSQLDEKTKQIDDLTKEINTQKANTKQLKNEIQLNITKIKNQEQQIENFTKETKSQKDTFTNYKKEITNLKNQIINIEREKTQITNNCTTNDSNKNTADDNIESTNHSSKRVNSINDEIKQFNNIIESQTQKINDQAQQIENLQNTNNLLEDKINRKVAYYNKKCNSLKKTIKELENKYKYYTEIDNIINNILD